MAAKCTCYGGGLIPVEQRKSGPVELHKPKCPVLTEQTCQNNGNTDD